MPQFTLRTTFARVLLITVAAGAVFAGTAAAGGSTVDKSAASLVPAKIKAKGTLAVAADASYAPDEFVGPDGHTVVGMDVDLAKALFAILGLKVNVSNVPFGTILTAMQAGRYDVGFSSFTDTKEREKADNFVDYFFSGESFFEGASGGPKVTNLASICGLTVAVETGTTEELDAKAQAKKCQTAGKTPDKVSSFENQSEANLALLSGRVRIGMADSQVASYAVAQSHGKLKVTGTTYGIAPYGIAVPKTAGTLDKAMLAALKDMIKNGSYLKILKKWGIQAGADTKPALNGATS